MDKILIIGTGGLAREFTSWFQDCFEIVGYSSKDHNDHSQFNLPGTAHNEDVTPELIGTNLAVLCIGNPVIKKQVFDKFSRAGFSFPSIIHHSSVNSDSVILHMFKMLSFLVIISFEVFQLFNNLWFCVTYK